MGQVGELGNVLYCVLVHALNYSVSYGTHFKRATEIWIAFDKGFKALQLLYMYIIPWNGNDDSHTKYIYLTLFLVNDKILLSFII